MKGFSAVFATFFIILIYDFVLRLFLPTADSLSFFSILLGSLTSLFFWAFIAQIRNLFSRRAQWFYAGFVAFFLVGLLTVNFFTLWKLGDFVNAYMLMFVSVDRGFIWDQLRLYAIGFKTLALFPFFLFFLWIWRPSPQARWNKGPGFFGKFWVLSKASFFLALMLVSLNQVKYETVGQHKWVDTSVLLAFKNFQKSTRSNVLRSSIREKVPVFSKKGPRPDIFIFVGESFGKQFLKLYGFERDSSPTFTNLFSSDRAFRFNQAISNSSCTDVSLPSLFSGVGPEESDVKLHDMPLIWDWLKSAGYYTIFASPQKFAFANFDAFILSPGPDAYLSADQFMSLGSFIAHNNGLDDVWAAKRTAEKVAQIPKDQPLFLVFFTNATHYPFLQKSSELEVQPKFEHPYENSLWIEDQSLKVLLESFQKNRSMDKLLIASSADHGELERHTRPVSRVASFYDEILAIPYFIKLPGEKNLVDESCIRGLKDNADLLVQNIDLLPTLLELVGFSAKTGHGPLLEKFEGRSLCHPVGHERILVGLNTNNIRQWNPEGFLLAKDSNRLVFTNAEGMKYFRVKEDPLEQRDLYTQMTPDLMGQFNQKIETNEQLTRLKNLYFPEGLFELQRKRSANH